MNNKEPNPQTLLDFALDAAWRAGRSTLNYYQTGVAAERKADNTPVTLADRQAEQILREMITTYWPDHGIIGEEYGHINSDAKYCWIIDPIDGTKTYVSGVPLYSTLLALTDGDKALVGSWTLISMDWDAPGDSGSFNEQQLDSMGVMWIMTFRDDNTAEQTTNLSGPITIQKRPT